jgi:hypothetical protein
MLIQLGECLMYPVMYVVMLSVLLIMYDVRIVLYLYNLCMYTYVSFVIKYRIICNDVHMLHIKGGKFW